MLSKYTSSHGKRVDDFEGILVGCCAKDEWFEYVFAQIETRP